MTVLDSSLATDLLEASRSGDESRVLELLHAGVVVSAIPPGSSCAALHVAAEGGHVSLVLALLAHGCPVDLLDRLGATALSYTIHAVAESPDSRHLALLIRVVRVLLDAGADPKAGRNREDAPLVLARTYERRDIEEMLLPHCDTPYFS